VGEVAAVVVVVVVAVVGMAVCVCVCVCVCVRVMCVCVRVCVLGEKGQMSVGRRIWRTHERLDGGRCTVEEAGNTKQRENAQRHDPRQ
jgi:hypothetical protein